MTTATKNRAKHNGATVLTPADLEHMRYPIPEGWRKAAGLLKGRGIDPLKYQLTVRAEWNKRLLKQLRLAKTKPK